MTSAIGIVLVMLIVLMTGFWAVAVRLRNGAVADVAYGLGFIAASVIYCLLAAGPVLVAWLMTAMVSLWALRLSGFLWKERIAGGAPEDARYVEFREKWGANANRNLLGFFLVQAGLIVVVSLPMALAADDSHPGFGPVQIAGFAIWVAAFVLEWTADRQLSRFKSDPSNRRKVCEAGLWNNSRHPNYFFEWVLWVGLALMGHGADAWWLGILSPALMLWFLTKVTGIPLAEAQSMKNRGEAYSEYRKTTSAFVPWFKRKLK